MGTTCNLSRNCVNLYHYRGLEQRSARHFNLVKVVGSNPASATTNFKYTRLWKF